jgi:hypothetical protein
MLRLCFIKNVIDSCLVKEKINLLFIGPHLISVLETQERKSSHFLYFFTELHCSLNSAINMNSV